MWAAPLTSGGTRHPGRGRRALRTSTAQAGPSRVGGESRQPSCEEAGRGRPRGGVWSPVTLSGVATKGPAWGHLRAAPAGCGDRMGPARRSGPVDVRPPVGPHPCGVFQGHATHSLRCACHSAAGVVCRVRAVAQAQRPSRWLVRRTGQRAGGQEAAAPPLAATVAAAILPSLRVGFPFCSRGEERPEPALRAPRAGEQRGRGRRPGKQGGVLVAGPGCRPSVCSLGVPGRA